MKKTSKAIQTKSDLRVEKALAEKNIKILCHGKKFEGNFIQEFLIFKHHHHEEPSRKGTPRGEKIGFPWKKQNACIALAVTDLKMKNIAEQLGISYGLLRKWKSEPDFQDEMVKHGQGFLNEILHRVDAALENRPKQFQDYIDGVNGKIPLDPLEKVMIDANHFGDSIMFFLDGLATGFLDRAIKKGGIEIGDDYYRAHYITRIIYYGHSKIFYPLQSQLLGSMVAEAKSIVQTKKPLSEKERRLVITRLDAVEKGLAGPRR